MHLFRQILVRCLVDREVAAGGDKAPKFANILVPRLRNMLYYPVREHKTETLVLEWKRASVSHVQYCGALS